MDKAFIDELEEVKSTYSSQNTVDLALLHGDLHPGNVMVDGDNFKIIDPEFCIYGPPGLDLGTLISGYVLAYVHQVATGSPDARVRLRACAEQLWSTYATKAKEGGISESVLAKIGEDIVAFAACEVARTSIGKAIPIEDANLKVKAEEQAVCLAYRLMMGRKGKGMRLLLEELERFVIV